ncbi:MAG: cell filamentation protein Fic [Syntrophobacteraceae bacterium CG23_combo_of_CG06-09_8_20_14_all_50_8]|nr:MAG: cell filamentation protein Fic [Syntrophobacteraceae bacterium CG23_combo_of_CG06-09_8_20_14_all_50_8]
MSANRFQKIDALKSRIDKHRPFDSHLLKQFKEYFRIGLTYASNALEGNSLTETETKIVIEDGITIGGKPLRDHYEAIGHSEAYDLLFELATQKDIAEKHIKELHRLFYYRIDAKQAGKYRKKKVFISGTDFIPPAPEKVPGLMADFAGIIPDKRVKQHPVEFAAWLHREMVTIHPFIDGNGRAARLLMNLALLQDGYPITIIPPVLRREYLNSLDKVHKGDDKAFINFIAGICYESAKEYLRLLES